MQKNLVFTKDWLEQDGKSFVRRAPASAAAEELPAALPELQNWAAAQAGQFAAVRKGDAGQIFLISDFARSIPLLFTYLDGAWLVSDSPEVLRDQLPEWELNKSAAEQFRSFGFTVGKETLITGVYQLPAASIVELIPGNPTPQLHLYHRFQYAPQRITEEKEFIRLFHTALSRAMQKVLARQENQQLVVPLSGGIDSRLLVVLLKECKAQRVLTFTYGVAGSQEMKISEQIATQAGFPWYGVEIDPLDLHRVWQAEGAAFLRAAWSGAALPHYQDWYALRELRQKGILHPGDIVLPGHTIVGNLYSWTPATSKSSYSLTELTQIIMRHYANTPKKPPAALRAALAEPMEEFAAEIDFRLENQDMQSWLEWFNVRERQAKYINNSMRAYEHFDLDFALPMLDIEVVRAWEQGAYCFNDLNRDWYRKYVSELYEKICAEDSAGNAEEEDSQPVRQIESTAPQQAAASSQYYGDSRYNAAALPIQIWRYLNRKFSIAAPLDRVKSVRAQLHHPMAFQAFLPNPSSKKLVFRLLAGSTLQAEFIRLFLANEWIPDSEICPK
ncbi:asparagine synthase C-terminal domain-containing protein [Arcanobacterium urinimassiliense]|uniref:asparagine synthase-related protein n=1 Tax=Arcanobacterium urinimassiliense TaxID=1871014 RepID=UPI0009396761|nr:asparagine synthase C-terminal domain-containing protein [Arcanobacterium urinimassiliense]